MACRNESCAFGRILRIYANSIGLNATEKRKPTIYGFDARALRVHLVLVFVRDKGRARSYDWAASGYAIFCSYTTH